MKQPLPDTGQQAGTGPSPPNKRGEPTITKPFCMELMYKLWQRAELGDRKRGKRSRPSRRLTGAGNYSPGAAGRSCAGKAPGNLRVGAPELLSGRQPNSRRWCEPPKAERRRKSCSTEPRAPREPGAKRVPPAECQDLADCGTDKSAGPRAGHALRSGADGRPGQTLLQPVPKSAHESGSTEPNEPQLI